MKTFFIRTHLSSFCSSVPAFYRVLLSLCLLRCSPDTGSATCSMLPRREKCSGPPWREAQETAWRSCWTSSRMSTCRCGETQVTQDTHTCWTHCFLWEKRQDSQVTFRNSFVLSSDNMLIFPFILESHFQILLKN